LEWGTLAPSGCSLISRTAFTGSSAITIDNLFSDTYENYLLEMQVYGSVAGALVRVQGRYGSTTYTGSNYQTVLYGLNYNSSTFQAYRNIAAGHWQFGEVYTTANNYSTMNLNIHRPSASSWLGSTASNVDNNNGNYWSGGALIANNQEWSGLYIFPTSGTLSGQVSVYGLAKS
jgi:hypothetical protein